MWVEISKEMEVIIEKKALLFKRTKEEVVKTALEEYLKKEIPIYISAPINALVEGLYEEDTLISDIKKSEYGTLLSDVIFCSSTKFGSDAIATMQSLNEPMKSDENKVHFKMIYFENDMYVIQKLI